MTQSHSRCLACLSTIFCLATATFGCSSDDNHGPVIGAPTTPVVISEGGSGNPSGGSPGFGGTEATSAGSGGLVQGGAPNFGVGGTGGTDPFGTGGSLGPSDPFGVGGTTSSSTSGTAGF